MARGRRSSRRVVAAASAIATGLSGWAVAPALAFPAIGDADGGQWPATYTDERTGETVYRRNVVHLAPTGEYTLFEAQPGFVDDAPEPVNNWEVVRWSPGGGKEQLFGGLWASVGQFADGGTHALASANPSWVADRFTAPDDALGAILRLGPDAGTVDLANPAFDDPTRQCSRVSNTLVGGPEDNFPLLISADGSTVVFDSRCGNLTSADHPVNAPGYLWTAEGGVQAVAPVSMPGVNQKHLVPTDISADGSVLSIWSPDGVWLWRPADPTSMQRVVEPIDGGLVSTRMFLSHDATALVVSTGSALVRSDTNRRSDLYSIDTTSGDATLITHDAAGRATGHHGLPGESGWDASDDGAVVTFFSEDDRATAASDDNGVADLFAWKQGDDTVSLVTEAASGGRTAAVPGPLSEFVGHDLSGDGSTVAFVSQSTELVQGFDQGTIDFGPDDRYRDSHEGRAGHNVFVTDLAAETTDWVTRRVDQAFPRQHDQWAQDPILSRSGAAMVLLNGYHDVVTPRLRASDPVWVYVGTPGAAPICPASSAGFSGFSAFAGADTCPTPSSVISGTVFKAGHLAFPSLLFIEAWAGTGEGAARVGTAAVGAKGRFSLPVPASATWTDEAGKQRTATTYDLRFAAVRQQQDVVPEVFFLDRGRRGVRPGTTGISLALTNTDVLNAAHRWATRLRELSPQIIGEDLDRAIFELETRSQVISEAERDGWQRIEGALAATLDLLEVGKRSYDRSFAATASAATKAISILVGGSGGNRSDHASIRKAIGGGSTGVAAIAEKAKVSPTRVVAWLNDPAFRSSGQSALRVKSVVDALSLATTQLESALVAGGVDAKVAKATTFALRNLLFTGLATVGNERGPDLYKSIIKLVAELMIKGAGSLFLDGRVADVQLLDSSIYTDLFDDDVAWAVDRGLDQDLDHTTSLSQDRTAAEKQREEARDTWYRWSDDIDIILNAFAKGLDIGDGLASLAATVGLARDKVVTKATNRLGDATKKLKLASLVIVLGNVGAQIGFSIAAANDARATVCTSFGMRSTGSPVTTAGPPCTSAVQGSSTARPAGQVSGFGTDRDAAATPAEAAVARTVVTELLDAAASDARSAAAAVRAATDGRDLLDAVVGQRPDGTEVVGLGDADAAARDALDLALRFVQEGAASVTAAQYDGAATALTDQVLASADLATLAELHRNGVLGGELEFGGTDEVEMRRRVEAATAVWLAATEDALDVARRLVGLATPTPDAASVALQLSVPLSEDGFLGANAVDDLQTVTGTLTNLSGRDLGELVVTLEVGDGGSAADGLVRTVASLPADGRVEVTWTLRHDLDPTRDGVTVQAHVADAGTDVTVGVAQTQMLVDWALLDRELDGLDDAWELANGLDPTRDDAGLDPDGDGLVNVHEQLHGTSPQRADTDADGLDDGAEVGLFTLPDDPDTDGDGRLDGADELPLIAHTQRLSGSSRLATAIAISREGFPKARSAGAVVLARADQFADGLAGTPLAVAADAPLLLSPRTSLDADVRTEIRRVLAPGGKVYVLGGTAALGTAVVDRLVADGFEVARLSGRSRFETAVAIADELGPGVETILLARGDDFPDALAAGPAAAVSNGIVLLTANDQAVPATVAAIAARPDARVLAVGGAASRAHPEAVRVAGADRMQTAVALADLLFPHAQTVGLARADAFPDALAGAALMGARGGPVLLTPTASLDGSTAAWIDRARVGELYGFGGRAALSGEAIADAADRVAAVGYLP